MDYVDMALESLLEENAMMRNITLNRMVAESEFILSSMENGSVGEFVQEASLKETARKVINALKEFIDRIVAAFRRKIVDKYKKYIAWVKDNEARIKEKAAKASITMAPYWEGDQKKGEALVESVISQAYKSPYKEDDISFATIALSNVKTKDDLNDTGKLSKSLKNKFRFNNDNPDNGKIQKVDLSGNNLVSKVGTMIDYVLNYENVSRGLDNLSNKWLTSSKNFTAVAESFDVLSKDMFLTIENTLVSNSDLSLLEGFDRLPTFVLEKDNGDSDKPNESLTSVQNNTTQNNDSNKNAGSASNRYSTVDRFVRLTFSAYLTACEERFIVYIKCISQILGESPKVSK